MSESSSPTTATPSPDQSTTISVSFQDVLDGRAFLRIPFVGRLLLAHWAGAPWFDRDPNAFLHPLQVEVIAHQEREKIVHGASRLGKSVLGGTEGIIELMLPNAKLAVVAQRYDHVGAEWQYIDKGMKRLFNDAPSAFQRITFKHSQNYHDYEVSTIWGSKARGHSVDSDDGAALLGQEFTRVIMGEGSHISREILEKRVLRALDGAMMKRQGDFTGRETGQLSIYTTPKGYEGCSAAEWERVKKLTKNDPTKLHYGSIDYAQSVWIREANILENPAYDKKVFEARKATLSKVAFEEQYLGKMMFRSGRVLKSFSEECHRPPMPTVEEIKNMRLGVGIDTGACTALVLGGVDRQNRKWVLGEVYTEQQTINESLEELRVMIVETLSPVFGITEFDDLKEAIDLWVVDPASQHKLEIMDEIDVALTTPRSINGGKFELLPTLETIDDMFATNTLFLADNHTDDLVDQLRKYVWKTVRAGQRGSARAPAIKEPVKDHDHLIDAMRFVMVTLDADGPLDEAPPVFTVKEAWDRAQRERVHGPLRDIMQKADDEGGMMV